MHHPQPEADRAHLSEAEARAFYDAFDKRRDYMRAEGFHWLVDGGEECVPLPGCPGCGAPGESVSWSLYEIELLVDVDPCGHRFIVEPVADERWLR
ncbi:hypothetical protein ACFWTC_03115 [Streptomyces sp. NPDC058619]|uniref:hypothetical protein n=1 Tax=unclassified Streptomyces TaxID=2593676 RepID=UPI00365FAD9A